jgi:NTP pyrophosphatase (non-canonical NTP hydrolase)
MTHEIIHEPKSITELIKEAHKNAVDHGWWEEERTFGEQIALMHSELSEALEDYRNGRGMTEIYTECKKADSSGCLSRATKAECLNCQYGKPCGIPIELADTIIRIFDTCGKYGIDLEKAIEIKMAYNRTRSYKHGGKKI